MKTIRFFVVALTLLTVSMSTAQNDGILKTKTTKTFQIEKDGTIIPYRLTIYKTSETPMKMDPADEGKKEQTRLKTQASVTKLILVDNDYSSDFDKYIVLRYLKDPNDSFELVPTKKGFKVVVDKKHVEYILGEGAYFVNNSDKDFFFIDEFDAL